MPLSAVLRMLGCGAKQQEQGLERAVLITWVSTLSLLLNILLVARQKCQQCESCKGPGRKSFKKCRIAGGPTQPHHAAVGIRRSLIWITEMAQTMDSLCCGCCAPSFWGLYSSEMGDTHTLLYWGRQHREHVPSSVCWPAPALPPCPHSWAAAQLCGAAF